MSGMCDTCMVDGHDICWIDKPDPDCSCCIDTASQHDWLPADWIAANPGRAW